MVNELYSLVDLYIGKYYVKTIIEAGACNCEDSVKLSQAYPNAHVYSFECNPETIPLCKKNIEEHDRITLTEKALSDTEGNITFYPIDTEKTVTTHENGNPGASSVYKANKEYPFETYAQKEITVPATTLKKFCEENKIESIDLLWLDLQGHELSVLWGLGSLISNVKMIQTEVLFKEQYYDAPLFDEICNFLEINGFRFACWVNKYEWSGDAIFIKENL